MNLTNTQTPTDNNITAKPQIPGGQSEHEATPAKLDTNPSGGSSTSDCIAESELVTTKSRRTVRKSRYLSDLVAK